MSIRASGYSQEEDRLLCRVYMDISQDPIIGVYQSSDNFWSRVEETYNQEKNQTSEMRSKRSIQSRIQLIEKATRKMHSCIRQIENRHPSGASAEDIMVQAKMLLAEDEKFKKGWKFDHVWNIIKNFEKFQDGVSSAKQLSRGSFCPSESESPTPESIRQPSPSGRPIGAKKAKLKKKMDDQFASTVSNIDEGNKQLLEQLKKAGEMRERMLETKIEANELKKIKEENKILFKDLSSLEPHVRAYVEAEQASILRKRAERQQSQSLPPNSDSYSQYFTGLGGSNTNLPEY